MSDNAKSIPGEIYRGQAHATLTVEPTDPGGGYVDVWVHVGGVESGSVLLAPNAARMLARDLLRRADLAGRTGTDVQSRMDNDTWEQEYRSRQQYWDRLSPEDRAREPQMMADHDADRHHS